MFLPKKYEVHIVSLTSTNEGYVDFSKLRLTAREHLLNGTITVLRDLDNESITGSAESFHDAEGNGEYKQLPFFIPRQPICSLLRSYWSYANASVKYHVNTDYPVHILPCPIPKGTYYIKDVEVKTDGLPLVVPRGFVKGVASIYEKEEIVGNLTMVLHITDKNL
ncbi:hypothetical protein KR074_010404 [Drosophila pseudoananassae]|nr:hypothetical protein KR074_010404 [Drosophila pseudoananassae]